MKHTQQSVKKEGRKVAQATNFTILCVFDREKTSHRNNNKHIDVRLGRELKRNINVFPCVDDDQAREHRCFSSLLNPRALLSELSKV